MPSALRRQPHGDPGRRLPVRGVHDGAGPGAARLQRSDRGGPGEPLFSQVGCNGCHVATTFRTPANPAPIDIGNGEETIRVPGNFPFNPYSDFLGPRHGHRWATRSATRPAIRRRRSRGACARNRCGASASRTSCCTTAAAATSRARSAPTTARRRRRATRSTRSAARTSTTSCSSYGRYDRLADRSPLRGTAGGRAPWTSGPRPLAVSLRGPRAVETMDLGSRPLAVFYRSAVFACARRRCRGRPSSCPGSGGTGRGPARREPSRRARGAARSRFSARSSASTLLASDAAADARRRGLARRLVQRRGHLVGRQRAGLAGGRSTSARSSTLASSRTLPGQRQPRSASSASSLMPTSRRPSASAARAEQRARQRLDVLGTLAQRRHPHADDRQAIEQVLAKTPRAHVRLQVAVGGGHEADVDAPGHRRSHAAERRVPARRAAASPGSPAAARRPRPGTACRRRPPRCCRCAPTPTR